MSKMARNKGKRGERMVIDWLQPICDSITLELGKKPVLLQRNTVQSDRGGMDIIGLSWLGAEVKNCEAQGPSAMEGWWQQTLEQAEKWSNGTRLIPVLFYTKARSPFRVRLMGWAGGHGGPDAVGVPCLVDLSSDDFELWFRAQLRAELLRS